MFVLGFVVGFVSEFGDVDFVKFGFQVTDFFFEFGDLSVGQSSY
jgi:hypothetical protein